MQNYKFGQHLYMDGRMYMVVPFILESTDHWSWCKVALTMDSTMQAEDDSDIALAKAGVADPRHLVDTHCKSLQCIIMNRSASTLCAWVGSGLCKICIIGKV